MSFKERLGQVQQEAEEKRKKEKSKKLEDKQKLLLAEQEKEEELDILAAETQRLIEEIIYVYPQMRDFRIHKEDDQITVVWNVRARAGWESSFHGEFSHTDAEVIRVEYHNFILKCDSDGNIYFFEGKQYVSEGDPKYARFAYHNRSGGVFFINLGNSENVSSVMDQLEQVLAHLVYGNNFGNFATAIENRKIDNTNSEKFTLPKLISEDEAKAKFTYHHVTQPLKDGKYGQGRKILSPEEYAKIREERVHISTVAEGHYKAIFA